MAGALRTAPRPRSRPGSHLLAASLLAVVAIVLTVVAVAIGPAIQVSRLHELALRGAAGVVRSSQPCCWPPGRLSRRVPVLVASVTVSGCAFIAGAASANRLHYPLAMVADLGLIAAAVILLLASRRPAQDAVPPSPPRRPSQLLAAALRLAAARGAARRCAGSSRPGGSPTGRRKLGPAAAEGEQLGLRIGVGRHLDARAELATGPQHLVAASP